MPAAACADNAEPAGPAVVELPAMASQLPIGPARLQPAFDRYTGPMSNSKRPDVMDLPAQREGTLERCNVEIKVRLADLAAARETAQRLAGQPVEQLRQVDTYFHCRHGRLKLRQIEGHQAQLIWYLRPDAPEARLCRYWIVPVHNGALLRTALSGALGVRATVAKNREVFLYQNVRIHLDEVDDLGSFLELEAVLGPGDERSSAAAMVQWLLGQFGAGSRLALSYADLAERSPLDDGPG